MITRTPSDAAVGRAQPRDAGMEAPARDELGRNIAAAAIAGAIQPALFNPLDTLRVRWQVAGSGITLAGLTRHIMQREGLLRGLFLPGQPFNCLAVASSQGLRMGLYPTVREAITGGGTASSVRPDLMAVAGLTSGSLAYFVSAPLFLFKTRSQASAQLGAASVPALPPTFGGYWVGCTPMVVRGALLTAGQMAG